VEIDIREVVLRGRTAVLLTSCLVPQIESSPLIWLTADISHALPKLRSESARRGFMQPLRWLTKTSAKDDVHRTQAADFRMLREISFQRSKEFPRPDNGLVVREQA
jgi:hypothetical protein